MYECWNWECPHNDIYFTSSSDCDNPSVKPTDEYLAQQRVGFLDTMHVPGNSCHGGYVVYSDKIFSADEADEYEFVLHNVDGNGGHFGVAAEPFKRDDYIWNPEVKDRSIYVDCQRWPYTLMKLNLIDYKLITQKWDPNNMKGTGKPTVIDLPLKDHREWRAVCGLRHKATVQVMNYGAVNMEWSIAVHHSFPAHVREMVETVLLLQQSSEVWMELPFELVVLVLTAAVGETVRMKRPGKRTKSTSFSSSGSSAASSSSSSSSSLSSPSTQKCLIS
eukprot:TRINITY_DN994_c0_g2_i2.p1 TRINITY_DN994_c0_g2~~TRINITY_DN994_c0_g2_i2.p1  ORF type:complete len:313 (+),score=96.26 TRINITY_DN994_c0_g2_i2:114-941(+)